MSVLAMMVLVIKKAMVMKTVMVLSAGAKFVCPKSSNQTPGGLFSF